MALRMSDTGYTEVPGPVFTRPAPWPGCGACRGMEREWVAATTPGHPSHNPVQAGAIVGVMRAHHKAIHGQAS